MKNKTTTASAVGLDVGTSRIVAASRVDGEFRFRSQLNAFVALPFSQMTARTLQKEGVPHVVQEPSLLVYGNESERFADLFHLEARRPMSGGILNPSEPEGPALLRRIFQSLGAGEGEPRRVCFSVPAPPLGAEAAVTYHEAALRELLEEMGHETRGINEGLAVVYSELEETNFTGIGISFGGGLCNVCLAYLSAPLFSFSVPKAGDFIDANAAAVTSETATRVRIVKETAFHFNGHYTDRIHQALSIYYADVIQAVVAGLHQAFSNALNVPKIGRAIPIVLSGGSTMAEGFRERFENALNERPLPVQISAVRLAAEPLHATAKGALVAALAEM